MFKKYLLLIIGLLLINTISNAQSKKPWWKNLFKKETVNTQEKIETKGDVIDTKTGIDNQEIKEDITIDTIEIESQIKQIAISDFGEIQNHNRLALDSINSNLQIEEQDGFRIQIFFGSLNSAKNIRANYINSRTGDQVYLELKAPNYVVVVGNYRNKIEAYQNLHRIQGKYPRALIVDSKIE